MKNPLDEIKIHFQYLINEYGFQIKKEEFSPQTMGNAYIVYISSSVGVRITIDRSQVLINIGDILDDSKEWFDFIDVLNFFSPTIENPYIFIKKDGEDKMGDAVEFQIDRLASMLRLNCDLILKGDLWMKDKIKEIEKRRVVKMLDKLSKLSGRVK